jgi:hypothetical protein
MLFLIPVFFLLMALLVMILWNALLPDMIHAGSISYIQAMGLLVLCRILFGGFGFAGGHHKPDHGGPRILNEKWMAMNDEEKKKFREEWKNRCNVTGHS